MGIEFPGGFVIQISWLVIQFQFLHFCYRIPVTQCCKHPAEYPFIITQKSFTECAYRLTVTMEAKSCNHIFYLFMRAGLHYPLVQVEDVIARFRLHGNSKSV